MLVEGRDVAQKAPVNMSTDKRFNEWMYHACLFKRDLRDFAPNFSLFFFAFIHTDISSKYICLFYSRLLDDFVTEFLSFSFCMVRLLCSHISFLDESVFFFRFFCMEIRLNFTYTELNI